MSSYPAGAPIKRGPGLRRELVYLACLLAFAGYLRMLAVGLRGDYLGFDESMYIALGKSLLSGEGYRLNGLPNATLPFGVPLIAGAFYEITGSARWALNLPTAIFGTLGLLPVYLIARQAWGRLTAVTAGLLYAGFPALLFLVPYCPYRARLYAGSEAIFLFFILSAGFFTAGSLRRPSVAGGLAAGFFFGAAFEVRQDALGYFAASIVLFYIFAALREGRRLRGRAAGWALSALAAFLILAAPWLVWVRGVTGQWSMGPRFSKTFRMRDSLEGVVAKGEWQPALAEYFRPSDDLSEIETPYYGVAPYHRERMARGEYEVSFFETAEGLRFSNLPRAWRALWRRLMPPAAWIFVLVGLVSAIFDRREELVGLLVAFSLPSIFVTLALYVLGRFYLVPAVVLLIFGARGLDICLRAAVRLLPGRLRTRRWAAGVYLVIPLALCCWTARGALTRARALRHNYDNFERRLEMQVSELVPLIRESVPAGGRLVAFSPLFEARADVTWLALPEPGTLGEDKAAALREYCRRRRADFLLLRFSDRYLHEPHRSRVLETFDGGNAVFDREFSGERFVLFDLRGGQRPR